MDFNSLAYGLAQQPAGRGKGTGNRVPPHNVEAERSVLGAILLSNESIHKVNDVSIEARDFYFENHQKIFETLSQLSQRGQALDLVTLSASLKDKSWFDAVGGSATLTSLVEDTFAIGNV